MTRIPRRPSLLPFACAFVLTACASAPPATSRIAPPAGNAPDTTTTVDVLPPFAGG